MKNIFKTLTLIFGIILFNSCDNELDLLPNDSVTPSTFYNNISDFENANKGLYSGFFKNGYYGGNGVLSRPEIASDNVIIAQNGRKSNQFINEWRYAPGSTWNFMYAPYVVINRANMILDNINNIGDGVDKDNFIAMAKASRALAMLDMLKVFSKIPTQSTDANASLGMTIVTSSDPSLALNPRSSVGECYNWAVNELESAKLLIKPDNSITEFNKDAINALLSRAYLYMGEYQKCIDASNAVNTSVADISNFSNVWTDASTDGIIFKLDQSRTLDNISIGNDWSQSNAGVFVPEYVMAFELYNLYQPNDIRKGSYTFIGPDSDGNNYNIIAKMFGESGQNNGNVDAKVFRASEVFLNKAEAYYMLGGHEPESLEALNVVRGNRYSSYTPGTETGASLLNAIKLERRLEFFVEGQRFFDLKRWNEPIVRSTVDGDFSDGSGTPYPTLYSNLSQDNFKFQFPIPQSERDIYPSLQQNPGY